MFAVNPGGAKGRQTKAVTKPLFVVSGGTGTSGELIARTVLAQFPHSHPPVVVIPHIHEIEQVEATVRQAAQQHGTVVHTLVQPGLRSKLVECAGAEGVVAIDLVGALLQHLTSELNEPPVGQPGLYRRLYQSYFQRVEAIEFTVNHDDGKRVADLSQADIILLGVSRVGKTPLSMYLSMEGWKVANVPVVPVYRHLTSCLTPIAGGWWD